MPELNADRNVLAGVLAVQMGLLSGEQLLATSSDWKPAAPEPLECRLRRESVISEEDEQLLRRVVERTIENYGGEITSCLEKIKFVDALAEDLLSRNPDAIHPTLSLVETGNAEDTVDTANLPRPFSRSRSAIRKLETDGRFKILRPHARGGLGEVSVAYDLELDREVALKEIQQRFVGDVASQARFLLEAKVTGGLEHPGIVPVYGLGYYDDGRPFYAMRFIQGESLKQATDRFHSGESARQASVSGQPKPIKLDQHALEFRGLLNRFIDVCNAIEYSHRQGVLHRDLKPDNIMLGEFGETLVVDWGLAKRTGRPDDPVRNEQRPDESQAEYASANTQAGYIIGTPAYMSPEQAAGRSDEIGPASDVYSLGATLYYLLTGQTPVRGSNIHEVLQKVAAGDIVAPQIQRPDVPAALESICLKAMAREPQQRYASPRLLAQDVERYLADEPVAAHQEPVSIRTRRWIRKHPKVVASLAAGLLVGLSSSLIIAAVVAGKNSQLEQANIALSSSYAAEQEARTEADERRAEAERLQGVAESNEATARSQSQLTLSTLNTVVSEIQRGLVDVPGASEVRRKVLATSLASLKDVATAFVDKSSVDMSTASALREMGDVVLQFGVFESEEQEAESAESDMTPVSVAYAFYEQAYERIKEIERRDPEGLFHKPDLALCLEKIGSLHMRTGRLSEAAEAVTRCNKIRERLVAAHPSDLFMRHNLSVSLSNLGQLQVKLGDLTAAHQTHLRAVELDQESLQFEPDNLWARRDLSLALRSLAETHAEQGATDKAIELLHQSLAIDRELAASDPDQPLTRNIPFLSRRDVSATLSKLGDVYLLRNDLTEALDVYEEAFGIDQELAAADPGDRRATRDLMVGFNKIGDISIATGDHERAIQAYQKAISIARQLAESDPQDLQTIRDLAGCHFQLARGYEGKDEFHKSLEIYEQARGMVAEIATAHPSNLDLAQVLNFSRQGMNRSVGKLIMVGDWSAIGRLDDENRIPILYLCVQKLAAKGQLDEAAGVLEKWSDGEPVSEFEWFIMASAYCVHVKVSRSFILAPTEDQIAREQRHIAAAITALEQAVEAGFNDLQLLSGDGDFEPLRGMEEFETILEKLKN